MSDVYEIKQPSELLITINALQSEIKLSKEDAQVILGYMQGHDFMLNRIGVNINEIVFNNNSNLYRTADKERLIVYMRRLNETRR